MSLGGKRKRSFRDKTTFELGLRAGGLVCLRHFLGVHVVLSLESLPSGRTKGCLSGTSQIKLDVPAQIGNSAMEGLAGKASFL